jgi:CpXC protein
MASQVRGTPRSVSVNYTCECGRTFQSTIHHAVNITLEPSLLYALLAGRLNVATCPNCGRRIPSDLPFLYHDMKRGLFAYVHPDGDLGEEEREQVLAQLRRVYDLAVQQSERIGSPRAAPKSGAQGPRRSGEDAAQAHGVAEPEVPPMQVIFGVDRLVALVESLLEPEERLGHIELHTETQDPAARQRFVSVADRIAREMGCQIDTADRPGMFTVEIFGPRSRIGQLVSVLHGVS